MTTSATPPSNTHFVGSDSAWRNHTKANPCPICGKTDRCLYTDDGAHRCFRVVDPPVGYRTVKVCTGGSVIFRAERNCAAALTRSRPTQKKKNTFTPDWAAEAQRFASAITEEQVDSLAATLNVTPVSLRALEVGWASQTDLRRLGAGGSGWNENYPDGAYVFPERDGEGKVIGLSFRAVDGRKGSPSGGQRGVIIPQGFESMPDPVLVVEGGSDVAAGLTIGLTCVGRPSNSGGAAHLAVLLKDKACIVLGENDARFDKEGKEHWPGRNGAQSIAQHLSDAWDKSVAVGMPHKSAKDLRAWVMQRRPDLTDPAACRELGANLLCAIEGSVREVAPAPPAVEIEIERSPGKTRAKVTATLQGAVIAVDSFDPASSSKRREFIKAIKVDVPRADERSIEDQLISHKIEHVETVKATPRCREELQAAKDAAVEEHLARTPKSVIEAAEQMLADPGLVNLILADIHELGIVGEGGLSITCYSVGTSRLLDSPLSAIVQGPSASGKSIVIERSSRLVPPEAVLRATDITPQALHYMLPGSLMHVYVVAGERSRLPDDERAEATRALREMLSSGRLSKAIPIKIGGRLETVLLEQEGPIAFIESTTLTSIFDEDANRSLSLGTDESAAQTERILMALAARAASEAPDLDPIIQRHHALQRLLRRVIVRVPFAERLARCMPMDRPEARRAFPHTLQMVQVIGLLHQRQRSTSRLEHGDMIDATLDDYRVAKRLLASPLGRALGGALPDAVTNLGMRLLTRYRDEAFTASQAALDDPVLKSRGKMGEYLKSLASVGCAEIDEPGRGNKPATWRMRSAPPEPGAKWLPDGDELKAAP